MIVVDVNLLVYAHNRAAPLHDRARAWWTELINQQRRVGLAWAVAFGFVRLVQAELHSNDSDFSRFPGLRWVNPLA